MAKPVDYVKNILGEGWKLYYVKEGGVYSIAVDLPFLNDPPEEFGGALGAVLDATPHVQAYRAHHDFVLDKLRVENAALRRYETYYKMLYKMRHGAKT